MGLQLVARLRGSGEPALEPLRREILNGAHHSFTAWSAEHSTYEGIGIAKVLFLGGSKN